MAPQRGKKKSCLGGRGCRKHPRHPSGYCTMHQPHEYQCKPATRKVAKIQLKGAGGDKKNSPLEKGLLKAFSVRKELKEALLKLTKDWNNKVFEYDPTNGNGCRKRIVVRKMVDIGLITKIHFKELMKLLQEITVDITGDIPGFCKPGATSVDPALIIAPKVGLKSNGWSGGVVHRDSDLSKEGGILSVEFVLDKILLSNGSVRFWPQSLQTPCDPSHPERYLETMKYEDLTAERGTVKVWDARMLHKSLPNKDNKTTVKIHWYIVTKSFVKKHGRLITH